MQSKDPLLSRLFRHCFTRLIRVCFDSGSAQSELENLGTIMGKIFWNSAYSYNGIVTFLKGGVTSASL